MPLFTTGATGRLQLDLDWEYWEIKDGLITILGQR